MTPLPARRVESIGAPDIAVVSAPEPNLVTLVRQIRNGGVSAVAAAENRDLHLMPTQPLCERSNTTPFGSRNLRSKSTPPPPFSSR